MKLRENLGKIRQVRIPRKGYPVEGTVAKELLNSLGTDVVIQPVDLSDMNSETGIFYNTVVTEKLTKMLPQRGIKPPSDKEWVAFSFDENQCC